MATWERTLREDRHQQRRKTPSFSSSLLDAIYRSIDESNGEDKQLEETMFSVETTTATTTMRRKQSRNVTLEEEHTSLRRAIMIEKWMENQSHGTRNTRGFNFSSSSSTDSSIFSSSETESSVRPTPRKSVSRPKQGRNVVMARSDISSAATQSPKREGRFMRTKSRALKIYGDLKKVKQPISPGGKITSFLNSLFNSRNVKKMRANEAMEDWGSVRKSRSVKDSTMCSSASSFSRSCLSKTPSSRGKSKRSVRFCPVSVIVDEDCRPCGHKNIYEDDPSLMPIPTSNRHAEEAAFFKNGYFNNQLIDRGNAQRDNPRAYFKKKMNMFDLSDFQNEEEEDDDVESCSSSDLFELENVGTVGIGTYREELPVYGTTNLKTNQAIAIANGLLL